MTDQPTPPGAPEPSVAPEPPQAPASPKARPASPQEIKAFTHPLRMRMYRLLQDHGQATASMLARETGESTGQTSYHLRQLERFGFVEELPEVGTGRERWWTSLGFSYEGEHIATDEALKILQRWSIDAMMGDLTTAAERIAEEDPVWLKASTASTHTQWMTAPELKALTEELHEVINRHGDAAKERHEEHGGTAGADAPTREEERRIRVYLHTLALPPLAEDAHDAEETTD